jgi:hypothetical protein
LPYGFYPVFSRGGIVEFNCMVTEKDRNRVHETRIS